MAGRIYKEKIEISPAEINNFFNDRVLRHDSTHSLSAVSYQDDNPELALKRDKHEKETILPKLGLTLADSVLDIGCGIGRWAEALVSSVATYHGTDLIAGMIDIAKKKLSGNKDFTFQVLAAQDNEPQKLDVNPPFSLIIITGLFIYLNDDDCLRVLKNSLLCAGNKCRIYIREPMAIDERLTLSNVWSEELKHNYSSIYRTKQEFLQMISEILDGAGFQITHFAPLFTGELANRAETSQHFIILERG